MPSDGMPYPLFALAALVPWTLLRERPDTGGATASSESANLITKVYFPRLIVPIASVLAGVVDFAIAFVCCSLAMMWLLRRRAAARRCVCVPLFVLLALRDGAGASACGSRR